jgi:hypothetical protein
MQAKADPIAPPLEAAIRASSNGQPDLSLRREWGYDQESFHKSFQQGQQGRDRGLHGAGIAGPFLLDVLT